jgi:septal ring factor EnvC (AmiA/AmiB activator)
MTLSDIKGIHKLFSGISKLEEFIDYIKAAHENKKLSIFLKEDKLVINIISEYLFKQQNIEIILLSKKLNTSEMITNLCQEISLLKKKIKNLEDKSDKNNDKNFENKIQEIIDKQNNEINFLKEELKKIKDENNNLKEENNKLNKKIEKISDIFGQKENVENISTILKNEECDMIFSAIKERMKKSVKTMKLLYQATKDGGVPQFFIKNVIIFQIP